MPKMAQVSVHEAKTHLSKLLRRVAEGEEIWIANAGRPVATLVSVEGARLPFTAGQWRACLLSWRAQGGGPPSHSEAYRAGRALMGGRPVELGLFAFMIGQGFASGGPAALRLARWVYTILMPTHARGAWHNVRVGRALGERAANLLEQPLERFLREPLIDVRRRLGLPETPEQGDIAPGHDSLLAKWLTPKPRAMPAASAA